MFQHDFPASSWPLQSQEVRNWIQPHPQTPSPEEGALILSWCVFAPKNITQKRTNIFFKNQMQAKNDFASAMSLI